MRSFPPSNSLEACELVLRAWKHLRSQDCGVDFETLDARRVLIDAANRIELERIEAIPV